MSRLETDPERYLAEYVARFGNILNADNAATLLSEYVKDPAKYRVAVHPAAQWLRDELFRRALKTTAPPERNRVALTAGGNASGKTTAIIFNRAAEQSIAVFDSTLADRERALCLVYDALDAGKAITILYIDRALDDALHAMIARAADEGRVVTVHQLVRSQVSAAETVRYLWGLFKQDPRFTFNFVKNSAVYGTRRVAIDAVVPRDYTENKRRLHEILNAECESGRIDRFTYARIRGTDPESVESAPG